MKANGGDSLAVAKASGELLIFSTERRPHVDAEDVIWTFVPPEVAPTASRSAGAPRTEETAAER